MAAPNPILKETHELYIERGRIIRRLDGVSLRDLKRFADAWESMSDDDLRDIAMACERMVLDRMEMEMSLTIGKGV